MAYTQLSLIATPGKRYSFIAKEVAVSVGKYKYNPFTGELDYYEPVSEYSEIRLIPKASSNGAEGTLFYDSDDDHIYVATE